MNMACSLLGRQHRTQIYIYDFQGLVDSAHSLSKDRFELIEISIFEQGRFPFAPLLFFCLPIVAPGAKLTNCFVKGSADFFE